MKTVKSFSISVTPSSSSFMKLWTAKSLMRKSLTPLAEAGIKLYGGVSGDADAAVSALLNGSLGYDPNVHCDHHDHEHGEAGHSCGDHGCGKHSCH